jgi:molybdate transport system substrate-binding protein
MNNKLSTFILLCKSSILKILSILIFFLLISCFNNKGQKLNIATAANMQFAMHDLIKSFSEETGIACEIIISSSGKLTAQIREGAPFDVFVSADMKYPYELFKNGFTTTEPKVYAYGKLVIWTMNKQLSPSFKSFTKKQVKHIALANPKTAPYGLSALEALKKKEIYDRVKNKLVFGENIAQTNQFITTYVAQIGFTSKSVVLSSKMKNKGIWEEVDPELYSPIAQGIVILKNRNDQIENAQKFNDFLFSDKGKEILNKFGYSVIPI